MANRATAQNPDHLVPERGAPPSAMRGGDGPNVLGAERAVSLVGGALLAGWGLRRGGLAGLGAAALGAALLARGSTRRDPVKSFLVDRPAARDFARDHGWKSAALANRSITINRPRKEVYAAWRDFGRLQHVLENIERIDVIDDRLSHWVAKAPGGETVEWDAEITEEVEGRRLAWRSLPNGSVQTAGEIEFRDAFDGRACEVRAAIAYEPPAGQLGRLVATLFQREPILQARRDLRRFKQHLETGEIATSAAPRSADADKQ